MVEQILDLPGNAVGFVAKGTVTSADYELVIVPAVEALFAGHQKARFLYHLGSEFSGFDGAAMWDDARLGVKHLSGWERIAVVPDVEWVRTALRIFSLVIPGHLRVFPNHELADATRWISE